MTIPPADGKDDTFDQDDAPSPEVRSTENRAITLPINPRKIMSGLLGVAVLSAVGFGAWKLHDTSTELDALHTQNALQADAEQTALNYATGAAQMDFRDLESWRSRLTANTTSALADRLNQAATSMEQIIVPLQWSSTAQPIAAKAEAAGGGTYSVDCFVSVRTTNAQSPEGIQSTATYKLTMDSSDGWRITEITGVGTTLGDEETAPAK